MLIPPSVLLIIWGIVIEHSIGKLFLAGFIPGIILAILMGVYCSTRAHMNKDLAPAIAAGHKKNEKRGVLNLYIIV